MLRHSWLTLILFASFFSSQAQKTWVMTKNTLLFDEPSFKTCHASTIVELKKGQYAMACFAGPYEGSPEVNIVYGVINGKGKVVPREVATGKVSDTRRFPCWNPVLFELNNKLILFYKVGPNPREWWGEYRISVNGGKSWSSSARIPGKALGPVRNKPVLLKNNTLLCPSSVEYSHGRWQVQMEITDVSLRSWEIIPVDTSSKYDVIQPAIVSNKAGQLKILCRSKQGSVIQSVSSDNGKTWSPLSRVNLPNPNSGIDAITLRDGRYLIVYNPDLPGSEWYNGRSKLSVAISSNGTDWQDIHELENETSGEYSYPAVIQASDGSIHITYTYDRKNIKYVVLKESSR